MTTPITPQTPTPTSHTHTPHMHFHETQVDTSIHGQTWVCTVKENPIFPELKSSLNFDLQALGKRLQSSVTSPKVFSFLPVSTL